MSPAIVTKSCPDRFGAPQTSTTLVYCIYEVYGRTHSTSITVSAGSAVQEQGCWHGGQAVRFDDKGTGVWIRDAYANEDVKACATQVTIQNWTVSLQSNLSLL